MAVTKSHSAGSAANTTAGAATAARLAEWPFVALLMLVMLAIAALPYVFAYLAAPADRQFMGIVFNVPDHAQYFAWMRDLASQPLGSNRMTPEPNDPAFFNLLWWSAGRFGALTGAGYAPTFHLLGVLAIATCLAAGYAFLQLAVDELRLRRLTFLMFVFSGGLGIVWVVVKYVAGLSDLPFPFDVYVAEPNTFFMLFAFPHFTLALGLVIATFTLTLLAQLRGQYRYAVAAGVVALVLGLQHAYDLITIYVVLGLFGLLIWLRDRRFPLRLFLYGVIVVGLSAPPAAYSFLLVHANPIWGEVLAQFDNAGAFTPGPLHLPILLGIPFLLAIAAFRPSMLRSRTDIEIFVAVWFLAHFVLVYLPVDFQIHLLLGWQVPIAILATRLLAQRVAPALAARVRVSPRAIIAALVALTMLTNVYLFAWRFLDLSRAERPYYMTHDEVAALDWLEANATADDVVLSTLAFGQYVPMWSDARAFLAHWANTLDFYGKEQMVALVLDANTPELERQAIVERYAVTYIVVSPQHGGDLPGFAPADAGRYRPVFQQGQVTIYAVVPPT